MQSNCFPLSYVKITANTCQPAKSQMFKALMMFGNLTNSATFRIPLLDLTKAASTSMAAILLCSSLMAMHFHLQRIKARSGLCFLKQV